MSFRFTKPYAIGTAALLTSVFSHNTRANNNANNGDAYNPYTIQTHYYDTVHITEEDPGNVLDIVSAHPLERDVVYNFSDGSKLVRSAGTRAWRNNNPGNLRYGKFAQDNGAIGTAGGFAVFPNEEMGMRALLKLLRSPSYTKLSISAAINRYAPPKENNTARYKRQLRAKTGLALTTKLSQLNDAQIQEVALAIRQIEGWTVGREAHDIKLIAENIPNPFMTAAMGMRQNTL